MLTSGASAATIFLYGNNLPGLSSFKKNIAYQNTVIRDRFGHVLFDMANMDGPHAGRRVVEPLQMPGHSTAWFRQNKDSWLVDTSTPGIPQVLQNATVATEDATFYSNPGFDPLSIMRAAYDNYISGHVVSGASTITQQLVRNYILQNDSPTLSRKMEEVLLSTELTQKYPKSQILWYYLNSVPYGNLSMGAEAASQSYFHTDVWRLNLPQAAFLAGLPEAPTLYDPVNNLPEALARMKYVLHLMYIHGYIVDSTGHNDPSVLAWAQNYPYTHHWKFVPPVIVHNDPQFVDYAIGQLQQIPGLKGKIYSGLDVLTTLDPRLQSSAQNIVTGQINQLGGYNVSDGALVSISTDRSCYGCIRAMVGSANYNAPGGQINMADTPRQPGSSFKPFNYIYAFSHGASPGTTVLDAPLALPDPGNPADGGLYVPTNYDHLWHGDVTLRIALQNSLNIPALKVEQFSGVQNVAAEAMKLGITSLMDDNPHCCGWSLTLGGLERGVRLVQETAGYGAFATGGMYVPPIAIWQVRDRTTGKILYQANTRDQSGWPVKRVIEPEYAYVLNNVLSDNNSRCTPSVCEFGLDSPLYLGRTAAAKTGTTNGFTDNWTVGYTPDLVTGVWVGNADNSPMIGTTGVTGAAPIWHDYMLSALKILNLPPKDFTEPNDVYSGSMCRIPGPYFSTGSMVYDIYAGQVPLCSIGTYNVAAPIPNPGQSTYSAPVAPAPAPAPVPTAPVVVPTTPPAVVVPTESQPGVQPAAPVPTPTPVPVAPQPAATQSPFQPVPTAQP